MVFITLSLSFSFLHSASIKGMSEQCEDEYGDLLGDEWDDEGDEVDLIEDVDGTDALDEWLDLPDTEEWEDDIAGVVASCLRHLPSRWSPLALRLFTRILRVFRALFKQEVHEADVFHNGENLARTMIAVGRAEDEIHAMVNACGEHAPDDLLRTTAAIEMIFAESMAAVGKPRRRSLPRKRSRNN
jgi:hypothetical protein